MHKKIFTFSALSLIEILITITIVLILCATSIYTYQDYKIQALYNSALNTMEQNKLIVSNFYAKNKVCPNIDYINQNFSSQSIASSITNDQCTLYLKNKDGIILSYEASFTDLGDLQYSCKRGANSLSTTDWEKYLSFCPNPLNEPPGTTTSSNS